MAPGLVRKMAVLRDSGYILWGFLSCLRAIFENFSSQIVVKLCRTDSSRRNGEGTAKHLQRGCCPCYQPSRESRHSLSAKGVMAFLLVGDGVLTPPKAASGNRSCPGRHRFARCPRLSGWRTESGRPAAPWGTVRCGRRSSAPVGFPPR